MPSINPMQLLQLVGQLKASNNPLGLMQQMFGNNPMLGTAMKMSEGKSPEQMKGEKLMYTLKELVKEAEAQADYREIVKDIACMLDKKIKALDHEEYDEIVLCAYELVYGEHFDEHLAKKAVSMMKNVDGTEGEHWDHEQTTNVARNNGIKFDTYNSWDWYYVMNMLYSDMCKIFGKDAGAYAKAAEAWLEDEDVAEGKAFRYYAKVVMC